MADDIAALGIQVDSSSVQTGIDNLNMLASVARRTGESVAQVQARFQAASQANITASNTATASTNAAANATRAAAQAHTAHATAATANAAATRHTTAEIAGLERAMGALFQQLEHSAGALGRLGSFLGAFGAPAVAAAGVAGTLVEAFRFLNEQAEKLGEKASQVKAFGEVTGLTAEQIQALNRGAALVGVSAQGVQNFVQRLSVNMAALREATGPVYEGLLKVSGGIAEEGRQATSTSQVMSIIARAMEEAGEQGNKLVQSIGGRGGVGVIPLLKAIAEAHGFDNFVASMKGAVTINDAENKQLAETQDKLNSIRDQNSDLFRKMFGQEALDGQLKFQENLNEQLKTWEGIREKVDRIIYNLGLTKSIKIFGAEVNPFAVNPFQIRSDQALPALSQITQTSLAPKPAAAAGPSAADLEAIANQWKAINAALGPAATAQDKFNARMAELATPTMRAKLEMGGLVDASARLKQLEMAAEFQRQADALNQQTQRLGAAATEADRFNQKVAETRAKQVELGASNDQLAASDARLNQQRSIELEEKRISALGSAATEQDKFRLGVMKLKDALADQSISAETAERGIAALATDQDIGRMRENVSALGDAATESEKYALAVAELKQKLDQGKISQDAFTRAVANANPVFHQLKESSEQFFSSFLNDLAQGNSMSQALSGSLKSVGSSLVNAGVKNIINNPTSPTGYIEAGIGFVAQLFGSKSDKQRQEEQQRQQAAQQAAQAADQQRLQNQIAGFNASQDAAIASLGTINNLNQAMTKQSIEETKARFQAQMQGNTDMTALEQQFATQRLQIQREYEERALDRQKSYEDRYFAVTNATGLAGALAAFDRSASQQRADEIKAGGEAIVSLEKTLAAERLKIIDNFNEQVRQREQTFSDRLLSATTDTSTLGGQLALFDRKAEEERAAEVQSGGEALAELEAAQAAERARIINDYNQKILEEQQKAAEEQLKAAQEQADAMMKIFQSIQDYLNQLQFGNLSTLGPEAQLRAAQDQFQQQLTLAQSGNQDALKDITKTADTLLNIAKSFYASSTGYADIYQGVTGSLANLVAAQPGLNLPSTTVTATGAVVPVSGTATASVGTGAIGATTVDAYSLLQTFANDNSANFGNVANSINSDARKNFSDLAATLVDVGKTITDGLADVKNSILQAEQQSEANARVIANQTTMPGTWAYKTVA